MRTKILYTQFLLFFISCYSFAFTLTSNQAVNIVKSSYPNQQYAYSFAKVKAVLNLLIDGVVMDAKQLVFKK